MIRLGIVDDHAVVRAGLKQYLSEHVDVRVTGEGSNGVEAMELALKGEIDVLLMDISMPDQSGVDAIKAIKSRYPELSVLILSGFPEAHYAATLLRLGASGYLNKECDPEEIIRAIRTVSMGRKYISQAVASLLAEDVAGGLERPPHESLSERELQKLKLASNSDLTYYAMTHGLIQ
jgi:two-component system, NarL family, invasion response regulator UvrY